MNRIIVIDSYDSFTFNIVQYLQELGATVDVFRNDRVSIAELEACGADGLLLSPGPGTPNSAGVMLEAIAHFAGSLPMLGVCLGHQGIGQHFGGKVVHAREIMHGKLSDVHHTGHGVFQGLITPFTATRYHSLVIDPASLPDELEVTAWTQTDDGERDAIMGVRHRKLDIEGVQFHPESISSDHGHDLLRAFLIRCGISPRDLRQSEAPHQGAPR